MDKSLDQMIKDHKTKRITRSRRVPRSARAKTLTGKTAAAKTAATKKATTTSAAATPSVATQAEKIVVSGLPTDVNEQQIKELFTTTVGPIKSIQLHYNPQGKWFGSATVIFSRKGDGAKAYEQYNNRLIDGKKPMKIELIFDPSKVPPPPLSSRVAPVAGRAAAGAAPMEGVQRTGRPGRPRRARRTRNPRPTKTVEDLDAEMEDYTAQTNGPAAA